MDMDRAKALRDVYLIIPLNLLEVHNMFEIPTDDDLTSQDRRQKLHEGRLPPSSEKQLQPKDMPPEVAKTRDLVARSVPR